MICPRCGHDNIPGADVCARCLFDISTLDRPIGQDRVEQSLMDDPVGVLPLRMPVTVTCGATVGEAIRIMLQAGVGAVLVVEMTGRLVGILSERDLLVKLAGLVDDPTAVPVVEVMTPDPITVGPADTLAFALHQMDTGGYRHLPVVVDGLPQGVVSVRDLLRHVTRVGRDPAG
jgi:CBS domain-containing protein